MSGSDEKSWPTVERRKGDRRRGGERRSGLDRRRESGWQPVSLEVAADEEPTLFALAKAARLHAQAMYSGFAVGVALQIEAGGIATGCNIENATYGLTICAERVALFKALSEGHTRFASLVVVADTDSPTPPCGACRQLLWEYCGDIPIVLANLSGPLVRYRLSELLPLPFDKRLLR